MFALQPAAWLGSVDDPARTQAPVLQLSYAAVFESLAFGGFVLLLALELLPCLGARRWPSPEQATLSCLALLGTFVIVVSNVADVYENNRAHYDIGSVMLVGALVFAAQMADRLAARRPLRGMTLRPA